MRNGAGAVVVGIRVLIDENGASRAEEPRKAMFGQVAGFTVRVSATVEDGPVCAAEGSGTALSIRMATGHETCAVGSVTNLGSAPLG
ncbi:hypothetical protein ATO6_07915 [Oceanicola sp. 22II-s10i]|nr:hypothetical protein ATO6_07915 [Oceanicola sp. 22II-s10i]